jgi:hypothetical protein
LACIQGKLPAGEGIGVALMLVVKAVVSVSLLEW